MRVVFFSVLFVRAQCTCPEQATQLDLLRSQAAFDDWRNLARRKEESTCSKLQFLLRRRSGRRDLRNIRRQALVRKVPLSLGLVGDEGDQAKPASTRALLDVLLEHALKKVRPKNSPAAGRGRLCLVGILWGWRRNRGFGDDHRAVAMTWGQDAMIADAVESLWRYQSCQPT